MNNPITRNDIRLVVLRTLADVCDGTYAGDRDDPSRDTSGWALELLPGASGATNPVGEFADRLVQRIEQFVEDRLGLPVRETPGTKGRDVGSQSMSDVTDQLAKALRRAMDFQRRIDLASDPQDGGKATVEAMRDALATYDALHSHVSSVPGSMRDMPRVRFNMGFHEGSDAAQSGCAPWMAEEHHLDPVYVAGYYFGVDAYRRHGARPQTSNEGWSVYAQSEWADRIHAFIVQTKGDGDEMELCGASVPEDELAALLSQPGVAYARNQDGVMVELSLDMDFETPVVRAVDMTATGPVYLDDVRPAAKP